MRNLTIFIQNCWWNSIFNKTHRFALIKEEITKRNPDIVCLQEVIFRTDIKHFLLPDYQVISKKVGLKNHGGLITLIKKPLTISQVITKSFVNQGNIFSLQVFELLLKKGILLVFIQELQVWVLNIHSIAQHRLIERHDEYIQLIQVQELLQMIDNLPNILLCGDLNFTPFSPCYKVLKSEFCDFSTSVNTTFPSKAQKLDYLWYKGNELQANICNTIRYFDSKTQVSDHFGLWVELSRVKEIN